MSEIFNLKSKSLKTNPLLYDPVILTNPEDLKLIDETRNFILYFAKQCFKQCINDFRNINYLNNYEKNCITECIDKHYNSFDTFITKLDNLNKLN